MRKAGLKEGRCRQRAGVERPHQDKTITETVNKFNIWAWMKGRTFAMGVRRKFKVKQISLRFNFSCF